MLAPLALAIIGLGILTLIAPRWFPGSPRRCETSSAARARPSRPGKTEHKTRERDN